MNEFEKSYYEEESYWAEERYQDDLTARRIELTAELIPRDCNSIVDIGCGNGVLVNYLANKANNLKRIVGVDRSESALGKVITEKYVMDIDNLKFSNEEFDCVTSLEVIEHLPEGVYENALAEIARISSKYIIVSVPHNEDLRKGHTQCPRCKTIFNSELHLRSFTKENMENLFIAEGFECLQTKVFFPSKRNIGAEFVQNIEARGKFNSPVCPLCGFVNKDYVAPTPKSIEEYINNPSIYNRLKQALKKVWIQKTVGGYWIIGLYKKK